MVWCGMVWCGVVGYGVVWFSIPFHLRIFKSFQNPLNPLSTPQTPRFQGAVFNTTDYDGRTPLHVACCNGDFKVVEYLLHYGGYFWGMGGGFWGMKGGL